MRFLLGDCSRLLTLLIGCKSARSKAFALPTLLKPDRSRHNTVNLLHAVKGEGQMGSDGHNHHNNRPWGSKGTFPYTLACTVKSRSSLASTPSVNRGKKREKKHVSCLSWAFSYLYKLRVTCVHPEVVSTPPQCFLSLTVRSSF
jgi:hypothetical protein